MTDITFDGLGSFVLFLFTAILFGFCILLLAIRQSLFKSNSANLSAKINSLFIQASFFPFLAAVAGLIALEVFNSLEYKKLFDKYVALAMLATGLLCGILWLITHYRKLAKAN